MKKGNMLIAALLFCVIVIYLSPVVSSSQTPASRSIYIFFNPRRYLLNVKYLISHFSWNDNGFKMIQVGENVALIDFKESAKILKYKSQQVEIQTECKDSRFLVLADNDYPGWKFYVKGSEKNVLKGEQSTQDDLRG